MIQTLFGPQPEEKKGLFARLKQAVQATHDNLADRLDDALRGRTEFDASLWTGLEEALIAGDVGVGTTTEVIQAVRKQAEKGQFQDTGEVRAALKDELLRMLEASSNGQRPAPSAPVVVLVDSDDESLAVKAVQLKPGGHHVMLMGVTKPLKAGETVPLTLTIEEKGKRSTIEVKAAVRPIGSQ